MVNWETLNRLPEVKKDSLRITPNCSNINPTIFEYCTLNRPIWKAMCHGNCISSMENRKAYLMASVDIVPTSKFSCLPVDKFVAYILPSTTTWGGTSTYGNDFLYSAITLTLTLSLTAEQAHICICTANSNVKVHSEPHKRKLLGLSFNFNISSLSIFTFHAFFSLESIAFFSHSKCHFI